LIGPRLFIVCGLPGSGKTTFAKLLEQRFRAIRFCPDEWMEELALDLYDARRRTKIEELQWKLTQELLAHGAAVILEWGTWSKEERDLLRQGARELGAAVELHYLSAPVDVLYERVEQRERENPPITRENMAHWVALFEEPTPEEAALFDLPASDPESA
jgi:predicted kinase